MKEEAQNALILELKTGFKIIATALIYATGIIPNTSLAAKAGIQILKGVLINDQLQTSIADIYALGEVSENQQGQIGIGEETTRSQGQILAKVLTGDYNAFYTDPLLSYHLDTPFFKLFSMGVFQVESYDDRYEVMITMNRKKSYYRKFVIEANILVGVILVGDLNENERYQKLINIRKKLSDNRKELF